MSGDVVAQLSEPENVDAQLPLKRTPAKRTATQSNQPKFANAPFKK